MKILFINTVLSKAAIYREPLGIMSLAAAIQHKHKVFLLEPNKEDVDDKIKLIKPDVIAYSVRTGYHQYYIDLNRKLKSKYNFLSVFGGPHATFFPEIIDKEGIDCICRGEGEGALLEFLDTLEAKGDITKVKNFWVKKDGQIHKNPVRPLIQNLDELNFSSRSLLDNYREIRYAKVKNFITGRGCPFDCSYCFNAGFKSLYSGQKYVRRRSVPNVINEVKEVKEKYGLEIAIFEDDTFNLDKKWVIEFSQEFRKLNLKFICIGLRVDLIDEDIVRALKEANCLWGVFGIESGNERVRREILNRNISNAQIIQCANLLKKYNISFVTENILGIPTSTLEEDLDTLKLNLICKPTYSVVHIMQPYPSTKIYEIGIKNNLYEPYDFDDIGDFYGKSDLRIEDKYARENLQRLFALTVRFPFIYPHIKRLINLRIRFLYNLLHDVYKGYIGIGRLPYRRTVKEYISLFKRYFLN